MDTSTNNELTIHQKLVELKTFGAKFRVDGFAVTVVIPSYNNVIGTGFSYDFAANKAWEYIQEQKLSNTV